MTNPTPSHPQRAGRPPRPEIVTPPPGADTMPADGGRVVIWSFYWSMYVMVDKSGAVHPGTDRTNGRCLEARISGTVE